METEKFRKLVNLDNPPPKNNQKPELADNNEEEDSDYEDKGEENFSVGGSGKQAEDITEQAEEEDKGKTKAKKKKSPPVVDIVMNMDGTKYIATKSDCRSIAVFHLLSGIDSNIEYIDDKTALLMKGVKQQWMYNASLVFQQTSNASRVFQQKGLERNKCTLLPCKYRWIIRKRKTMGNLTHIQGQFSRQARSLTLVSKLLHTSMTRTITQEDPNQRGGGMYFF